MRRYRRLAVIVLVVLSAALAGLAASEARRDTTPPKLYIEAPSRVEAGTDAHLLITADEPVTYRVRYGDVDESKVTQDWKLALTAETGQVAVDIEATDGAGNSTDEQTVIDGVAAPSPNVASVGQLQAGDPLGVAVSWGEGSAQVTGVTVSFDGTPARVIRQAGGPDAAEAIAPVPLGTGAGAYPLKVTLADEFGFQHTVTRSIVVTEPKHPVELILLQPSVLAQDTAQNATIEQTAFHDAFATTGPTPDWQQPFEMPIKGVVSAGFGSARRFVPGGPVSYHTGVDLAVDAGTPIHAVNDGVVALAEKLPISGNVVAIDHGAGVFSLYFHQSKILVQVGETVTRGQVIGLVGTTGLSSGPHLHWEMRVDGVPTNPLAWVGHRYP
ncbi:MAG TPA: M23 family metallopeptidase [Trueperaceae bacterium]|nr:M23 family metallopeptidase [Trueperaceae bacterium]